MTSTRFCRQDLRPYSFLIIGYGNELRGDDAVGGQVAQAVAQWHLPDVQALIVHQLLPELAIEVAKSDYVVFIDACGEDSCARSVQIDPIVIGSHDTQSASTLTHTHSARGLLRLTEQIYGYTPQAWLLQVPSESFDFGQQLSSTARSGCDEALRVIERFLTNYRTPYSVSSEPCMKSA